MCHTVPNYHIIYVTSCLIASNSHFCQCVRFHQGLVVLKKHFFQAVILPTRQQATTVDWQTDRHTDRHKNIEQIQIDRKREERERNGVKGRRLEADWVKSWKMAVEFYKKNKSTGINQSINKTYSVNSNIHRNTFGFLLSVYSFIDILIIPQKSNKITQIEAVSF